MTCKDKTTQPSSPQRHAAELTSIVTMNFSSDGVRGDKPILVLVTGGCPDHCLTYALVKVFLLSSFMLLNLDMIAAVRTCPYQIWTNLAERIMSTLNLALQNVPLSHKEMSSEAESRLMGKKTLAEVHKEINGDPTLTQEIVELLDQPILALTQRFRAMKLKDEPIQCGVAATAEAIQRTFERVHFTDPNPEQDKLSADTLGKSQPLSKLLEKHCQPSHTTVFS